MHLGPKRSKLGGDNTLVEDQAGSTPSSRNPVRVETVSERDVRDGDAGMAGEPKEDDGTNQDSVLADIARENRDRKAVKSDDAAVPEYLWEDHLLEGLKEREWDDIKLAKVRRVATWLRSKMLQWWKRK